jgi:hypothetical protein
MQGQGYQRWLTVKEFVQCISSMCIDEPKCFLTHMFMILKQCCTHEAGLSVKGQDPTLRGHRKKKLVHAYKAFNVHFCYMAEMFIIVRLCVPVEKDYDHTLKVNCQIKIWKCVYEQFVLNWGKISKIFTILTLSIGSIIQVNLCKVKVTRGDLM